MCGMFFVFLNMFHRSSAGVLRSTLVDLYGLSATEFSSFSVMYFYPYVIMQFPAGVLADRIGPRKLMSFSSLLSGIGILCFSLSKSFRISCLCRILTGIGFASAQTCCQKLNNQWFQQDRIASAVAVTSAFGYIGTLCAQAPLALLIQVSSWRTVFFSLGIISMIFVIISYLFVCDKPQDIGLMPINSALKVHDEKVPLKSALKSTFGNKYLYPLLFALCVQLGTYNLFSGTWGVSYFEDVFNLTTLQASKYTMVLSVGCAVFGLLLPVISDAVRIRKLPLSISFGISALLWKCWFPRHRQQ